MFLFTEKQTVQNKAELVWLLNLEAIDGIVAHLLVAFHSSGIAVRKHFLKGQRFVHGRMFARWLVQCASLFPPVVPSLWFFVFNFPRMASMDYSQWIGIPENHVKVTFVSLILEFSHFCPFWIISYVMDGFFIDFSSVLIFRTSKTFRTFTFLQLI